MHTMGIEVLTDALLVRFHRLDLSDFKSQPLCKFHFFPCDLGQDTNLSEPQFLNSSLVK